MKAVYEQITSGSRESVLVKKVSLPEFDAPFHFHPEYELTFILKGSGLRYVGMNAEPFYAGDLILLGPNLPHCWINYPEEDGSDVQAYVVQFGADTLENSILKLPEFYPVLKLFKQATGGISFHGLTAEQPFDLLHLASNSRRIIQFLDLLLQLADTPFRTLVEKDGVYEDQQRFKVVFGYLIEHFREPIELGKIADLVGLTPTSFCCYFKKMTGKTLFDVVLQYRLEAAAQLLLRTTKPVNEIAFSSGFENAPYFNRAFKKWKGVSLRVFRNHIHS
jgi:AraC-like DNA-binding protein/mannose-6-phosphate isomerase-like protein (cupin superfamily)